MPKKETPKAVADAIREVSEIENTDPTAPDDGAPLPAHAKRGNARGRVLQVRLTDDEITALERIAEIRELPVSTIARQQLLNLIANESIMQPAAARLRAAVGNLEALLAEFNADVNARILAAQADMQLSNDQAATLAEKLGFTVVKAPVKAARR